jgi:hypothetical protein
VAAVSGALMQEAVELADLHYECSLRWVACVVGDYAHLGEHCHMHEVIIIIIDNTVGKSLIGYQA